MWYSCGPLLSSNRRIEQPLMSFASSHFGGASVHFLSTVKENGVASLTCVSKGKYDIKLQSKSVSVLLLEKQIASGHFSGLYG